MNNRQRISIATCMEELTEALLAEVFLSHLLTHKIFSRNEIQIIRKSCLTDEETICLTLNKLKHKSDAWDCLIGFLTENRYGELVEKLILLAAENSSDDIEYGESMEWSPVEVSSSSSTVNSYNFPDFVEWLNSSDLTDRNSPTSELFEDNLENLATSETVHTDVDTKSIKEVADEADDISLTISDLTDRYDKPSPSELLPDVIKLMQNQMNLVWVQMSCQWLIDQYSSDQLRRLESPLRQRLIGVLLSGVKLHCHDSLVVRKFCDLLVKIYVSHGEVDWYLGSIDFLLEIICDDNNFFPRAQKSVVRLLMVIAEESDVDKSCWILQSSFVEKICQSITIQLGKSEHDEIIEIGWACLIQICSLSAAIKKRFVDAGGISLFQQCYKKFNQHTEMVCNMTSLMLNLSKEELSRSYLIASLEVFWAIWTEQIDYRIASNCFLIFSNILQTSDNWPLGHPSMEKVKINLEPRK